MKNPSLAEIQTWMKSRIHPSEVREEDKGGGSYLNPQAGDPGEDRLAVYAGGLIARTEESFEEVYEAIRFVIGPSRFHELVCAYSQKYPSTHYNLTFIGRHLSGFLKEPAAKDLLKGYPFLSDLAVLEWRVAMAFHAFDGEAANPQALKNLTPEDWEKIRFSFQPSVAVTSSAWPVLDIWQARKLSVKEVNIEMMNRPQAVLIYRQGVAVECERISPEQFALLEKLISGQSLAEAFEKTPEVETLPIGSWFSQWAATGIFRQFQF
ncbi:MAG: putative DNA-binding domain-containing protein [Candidatus Omnitrophica bacterium]|nr:putative DNA-binding domain-containing protein [Candidatus Omnitrophota bacterium]